MPSELVDNYIASDVKTLIWTSKPEFKAKEKGSHTGAPPWMTKGAAIRPFGDGGGAGVLDWQTHQDALRAHWLVRYIDSTTGHWKLLMDHWIFKNNSGPTDRASSSSVVVLEKTLGRPWPVPVATMHEHPHARTRTNVPTLSNSDLYYVRH